MKKQTKKFDRNNPQQMQELALYLLKKKALEQKKEATKQKKD